MTLILQHILLVNVNVHVNGQWESMGMPTVKYNIRIEADICVLYTNQWNA